MVYFFSGVHRFLNAMRHRFYQRGRLNLPILPLVIWTEKRFGVDLDILVVVLLLISTVIICLAPLLFRLGIMKFKP
jgi:hypothetical protein